MGVSSEWNTSGATMGCGKSQENPFDQFGFLSPFSSKTHGNDEKEDAGCEE